MLGPSEAIGSVDPFKTVDGAAEDQCWTRSRHPGVTNAGPIRIFRQSVFRVSAGPVQDYR
jgi:hypothetical protein